MVNSTRSSFNLRDIKQKVNLSLSLPYNFQALLGRLSGQTLHGSLLSGYRVPVSLV